MHATVGRSTQLGTGRPIRGTFYPTEGIGGGSAGSVVPKVLAIVVAVVALRAIVAGKRAHGGSSRWGRRRAMIAELHRELHTQESEAQPEGAPSKA